MTRMGRGGNPLLTQRCLAPRNRTITVPTPCTFTHQREYGKYGEAEIVQALGRAFTESSHRLCEEIVHGLLPALRSARDGCHAPGHTFIMGLLGFDDACERFEENPHGEPQFDATEVSPPNFFVPTCF
jgi:hypothetical protein